MEEWSMAWTQCLLWMNCSWHKSPIIKHHFGSHQKGCSSLLMPTWVLKSSSKTMASSGGAPYSTPPSARKPLSHLLGKIPTCRQWTGGILVYTPLPPLTKANSGRIECGNSAPSPADRFQSPSRALRWDWLHPADISEPHALAQASSPRASFSSQGLPGPSPMTATRKYCSLVKTCTCHLVDY